MTENIMFMVSKELKEQLKNEAKERGLTLSGYIKAIIAARKK
jgi:predicted DNA-binding protein